LGTFYKKLAKIHDLNKNPMKASFWLYYRYFKAKQRPIKKANTY